MNSATQQAALSALRSILIAVGAWLAARGILTEALTEQIIGAVMTVLPFLWGIWNGYNSEEKTQAREVVAVNAGIVKADATVGQTPLVGKEAAQQVIETFSPANPPK